MIFLSTPEGSLQSFYAAFPLSGLVHGVILCRDQRCIRVFSQADCDLLGVSRPLQFRQWQVIECPTFDGMHPTDQEPFLAQLRFLSSPGSIGGIRLTPQATQDLQRVLSRLNNPPTDTVSVNEFVDVFNQSRECLGLAFGEYQDSIFQVVANSSHPRRTEILSSLLEILAQHWNVPSIRSMFMYKNLQEENIVERLIANGEGRFLARLQERPQNQSWVGRAQEAYQCVSECYQECLGQISPDHLLQLLANGVRIFPARFCYDRVEGIREERRWEPCWQRLISDYKTARLELIARQRM